MYDLPAFCFLLNLFSVGSCLPIFRLMGIFPAFKAFHVSLWACITCMMHMANWFQQTSVYKSFAISVPQTVASVHVLKNFDQLFVEVWSLQQKAATSYTYTCSCIDYLLVNSEIHIHCTRFPDQMITIFSRTFIGYRICCCSTAPNISWGSLHSSDVAAYRMAFAARLDNGYITRGLTVNW